MPRKLSLGRVLVLLLAVGTWAYAAWMFLLFLNLPTDGCSGFLGGNGFDVGTVSLEPSPLST